MADKAKTDRRVLYTKMFLKESLLDLMKEKPIDKITPTELCRKANINRNTFYTHYYTPRDVLTEIENDFSTQIIETLRSKFTADDNDISQMLKEICNIIYTQREFCKVLLSENGDAAFLESTVLVGKRIILDNWKAEGIDLGENEMEMFFSFIVNGSTALIKKWAAMDMRESPEKIAILIERFAYGGINGLKEN